MSTFEPLNPKLFRSLKQYFGTVRVSNEGEAFQGHYRRDFFTNNTVLEVDYPGEYYQVCCPHCHDTRFRCYINHRWGNRDEQGRQNLWLIICYNENCFAAHERRVDLWDDLHTLESNLDRGRIREGKVVDEEARELQLPGPVVRLDKLPPDHPANVYLAGRMYNPERLGRVYKVGYCANSNYYLARNRIIVPIHHEGKLRGWQARHIGELDWKNDPDAPPKWFTGPGTQRAKLLYNFDVAKKYKTGVVVEGAGDVWSFGPPSMAAFGSTVTMLQRRMLVAAFGKESLVLLLDPDVLGDDKKESEKKRVRDVIADLDGKFKRGFAPVWLPEGTDPGKLDRGFLREYVAAEAKAQGVKVSWNKR